MRPIRLTDEKDGVLSAGPHSPEISHERYGLILSRVQLVSRFFSVVILLWVGVEFACWPWPISGLLALERVFAAGALWTLGTYRFERQAWAACRAVMVLLLIPASLILGGEFVLAYSGAHLEQQFGTQAYIFSPFLLAATLSIFPLSMRESALLAAPTIAVAVLPMVVWPQLFAATSPRSRSPAGFDRRNFRDCEFQPVEISGQPGEDVGNRRIDRSRHAEGRRADAGRHVRRRTAQGYSAQHSLHRS